MPFTTLRLLLSCEVILQIIEREGKTKNLLSALFIYREELLEALQDDLGKPTLETEVVEFHPTVAELKFRFETFVNDDERLVQPHLSFRKLKQCAH